MNKLIQIVTALVIALLFEAVIRRIDASQADAQEAAFLDNSVEFVKTILDEIPNVPPYIKLAIVQPALIKPVAKFANDVAEREIAKLLDQAQGQTS